SGLAFVVVQHLDPTYKGMIVELLQRAATIPVVQIEDGMKVEPEHVYVIPPNCDLSMLHGVLYLLEPAAPRGLRLPIDFFFRALADDQQALSIGVILSGMGSDGMLGLRAIKEKAGAVFVQTPASAKFDGMPRSAVDDGQADVVADAAELPGRILGYLQHLPTLEAPLPPRRRTPTRAGWRRCWCCCAHAPAMTSRTTRRARSTAASSAAWGCTSSPTSATMSVTCATTHRKPSSCSRNCSSVSPASSATPRSGSSCAPKSCRRCSPPIPRAPCCERGQRAVRPARRPTRSPSSSARCSRS